MFPRVTLMNAVSLDSHTDWIDVDLGLFYGLAADLEADAHLTGADTILAGADAEPTGPDDQALPPLQPAEGVLLAITDSRGRVRNWRSLRRAGYWQRFVSLCSRATPADHIDYLRRAGVHVIVAGEDKVDMREALQQLADGYAIGSVHLDSGGTLSGSMLRSGLVDAVRLLVLPFLVGGTSPRSFFRAPDLISKDGVIKLALANVRAIDGGMLLLDYEVVK